MREGTRNFLVGLAATIALLGLAALLMSFGELDPLFHPRYAVRINTDNASGLRAGSSIDYNGVPIGVVRSVESQPHTQYPVRVIALVDKDTRMPADVQPFVSLPLIGTTAILQFRSVSQDSTIALPDDGTAEITAPIRGGMFSEFTAQLDERMKPLMASLERFNRLSDTFVSLGENLNSLLELQTTEQLSGGDPPNLRTAVVQLNRVLDDAEHGLELANSFLGDEQMRSDAQHAVRQATVLIDNATTAVDRYVRLAQSLETNADEFTKRLLPMADTLGATLEEVRRVSKAAIDGQGTMGHLLNNPDLYNSLNDAATRLDRTLVELQILIEQLRAEGFIISF